MFRFLTAGESHGPALTAVIDGIPAGLPITADPINVQLKRRQGGYGRGARQKIESDTAEILSGIRFGVTMGGPITLVVRNRDWANWTVKMSVEPLPEGTEAPKEITVPRPGHADYTGMMKYGHHDLRNTLERSSARNTATLVAVGAVARVLLAEFGISVASHVVNIGGIKVAAENIDLRRVAELSEDSPVRVADKDAEAQIIAAIDEAKYRGDTLGGTFEVVALGLPVGLGSYSQWDTRIDGKLAQALMAIQAIKGVEVGIGFHAADIPGSQVHDAFFYEAAQGGGRRPVPARLQQRGRHRRRHHQRRTPRDPCRDEAHCDLDEAAPFRQPTNQRRRPRLRRTERCLRRPRRRRRRRSDGGDCAGRGNVLQIRRGQPGRNARQLRPLPANRRRAHGPISVT